MRKILVWVASPEVYRMMQEIQLELELDRALAQGRVVDVVTQTPVLTWLDDLEELYKELTKIEISQVKPRERYPSKPERGWKYWRPWAKRQWQRRRK